MAAVYTHLQDVFNKIWKAFVIEGQEQAMDDGDCVFRGNDRAPDSNVRCAIGVCIPNDMYDPHLEGMGINEIAISHLDWYDDMFDGIDPQALGYLQTIHDIHFDTFESRMRRFAEVHGLHIPLPEVAV